MNKLTDSDILSLMDKIRGIAVEGLNYATTEYDRERYTQLLDIVSNLYGNYLNELPSSLVSRFKKELGSCTPKLGVDVVVQNKSGQLLALRRSDDNMWGLPCGWVQIGETPLIAGEREVFEETGIKISSQGFINISIKGPIKNQLLHHQLNLLLISESIVEQQVVLSHEHIEFAWINNSAGREWHPGHADHVDIARAFIDRRDRPIIKVTSPKTHHNLR